MRAKLLRRAAEQIETEFQGIPIVIEWPKGSVRTGTNKDGEHWERKMLADYGKVPGTSARGDNEELDVYIGPDHDAPDAWVVEQLKDDGSFDEYKVMLGFDSLEEAREMYLKHYPAGWEDHVGDITRLPVKDLWVMVDAIGTVREQRMETLADEHEKAKGKQAEFFRLEDLREIGRRELEGPRIRKFIEQIAPGKTWDELDKRTQCNVLILEQNDRLGIDDPLLPLEG